nr:MAG TPA: hypothetical protein [Caudoviricetes sp.]
MYGISTPPWFNIFELSKVYITAQCLSTPRFKKIEFISNHC